MKNKNEALQLFIKIGYGKENAVKRPGKPYVDRELRNIVNAANKNGDCIINMGKGYYRPIPGRKEEVKELDKYLWSELKRSRDILLKRLSMLGTFKRWKEVGVLLDHTGETR